MRSQAVVTFLFIAVLSVFMADLSVGCGGGDYVYGPVSQKMQANDSYKVVVNGNPYEVPADFYYRVQLGDNVRFNGREWSIVKPGETNVPATVPAPPTP